MIRISVFLCLLAFGFGTQKKTPTQVMQIWGMRFLTVHAVYTTTTGEFVEIDGFSTDSSHHITGRNPITISRKEFERIRDTIVLCQSRLPRNEIAGVEIQCSYLGRFDAMQPNRQALAHTIDSVDAAVPSALPCTLIKGVWQKNIPKYIGLF